jgi:hypothetical protein
VSGWDIGFPHPIRTNNILPEVSVCLSRDGGRTWTREGRFARPAGSGRFMPFGNLVDTGEAWFAPAYDCRMSSVAAESRLSSSYLFASEDRGQSWSARGPIGEDRYTETDVLPVANGWIAVARTLQDYGSPGDPQAVPCVRLMRGSPDGTVWTAGPNLTVSGQHPGNLLRLRDGRIVFSCGSRVRGFFGVLARVSGDEGQSWSAPLVLASDCLSSDQGYPSSVELGDGTILTAYYSKESSAHRRYHMATVSWRLG